MRITVRQAGAAAVLGLSGTPSTFPDSTWNPRGYLGERVHRHPTGGASVVVHQQLSIVLDGYTWHCNRHTFASRLVMAGVDIRSVQALGGWRTLSMVQRHSHLAPAHLQDAVERLLIGATPESQGST